MQCEELYAGRIKLYKGDCVEQMKYLSGKINPKLIDGSEKKPNEYKDNGYRYPSQILNFSRDNLTKVYHPTQKPVKLIEWIIKTFTKENDLVLDFTMGSGTTGVACMNTNRKFMGVEIDENYYDIAKERLLICVKG